MVQYQPVIGLEIHVELKTNSKMFCQCLADYFGKPANSQVCPVCLGLPGALPVPNKKAIEWTILLGLALNCQINKISKFDRKHYFYPDLPKGYQISQYDEPIAVKGQLPITKFQLTNKSQIFNSQSPKIIRINRVHLEEDTGKLIHKDKDTFIDFNRSGVPLVEIVTEPDFTNADDVKTFLEELQVIIRYLNISDADMEKGSMRLEPNISVKKYQISNIKNQKYKTKIKNSQLPDYKVEIKNINSFRFVKQAIEYEIKRQTLLLDQGQTPIQETRGYNSEKGITYSQRSKEAAHDYRYFPEPDIPPMVFDEQWLNTIKRQLPELPQERSFRFVKEYCLKPGDAFLLTRDKNLADYFETVVTEIKKKKLPLVFKEQRWEQIIANLIINKKISTRLSIVEFIEKTINLLLPPKTDEKQLNIVIDRVINTHPKAVADFKKGKVNAIMFLMGEVMRELKGKAEAKIVIEKIKGKLSKKTNN